jgi:hypothetical protein
MKKQSYTVTINKIDGRTTAGVRTVDEFEVDKHMTESESEDYVALLRTRRCWKSKYEMHIRPTYIERKNVMTGKRVLEHFNTPYSCSVASESYWQN